MVVLIGCSAPHLRGLLKVPDLLALSAEEIVGWAVQRLLPVSAAVGLLKLVVTSSGYLDSLNALFHLRYRKRLHVPLVLLTVWLLNKDTGKTVY